MIVCSYKSIGANSIPRWDKSLIGDTLYSYSNTQAYCIHIPIIATAC